MNIFILDTDPKLAAVYHGNRHVLSQIKEICQMMSTAHRLLDGEQYVGFSKSGRKAKRWKLNDSTSDSIVYSATHINHPCAVWVRQSKENYTFAHNLLVALCSEYTYRYGKIHKTFRTELGNILKAVPKNIKSVGLTPFAQAMPDEYRHADVVTAYRAYYKHGKSHLHNWKNREVPDWIST